METNNRLIAIQLNNMNFPIEFTAKEFKVLDNGCIEVWSVCGLLAAYNKGEWVSVHNGALKTDTARYIPHFMYEAIENYIEAKGDGIDEAMNPVKAWLKHMEDISEMYL